MNDAEQEHYDKQEAQNMRATAQQVGMRAAAEHKEHTVHNAQFLDELRDADLDDSELFGWLTEEYPEWFSGAHAVSNRPEDWDTQADLLMMNKRERAVAEQRPGRLLRDRPFLHAVMTDKTPAPEAFEQAGIPEPPGEETWRDRLADAEPPQPPLTSQEKSRLYGAAEVAADLMALSAGGAGLESVSTVKTETSVRREEEDESTKERVGRMLG
jgi:hypothetical protein